ncbi:TPA: HNH endonuclease [Citrobacter freundii]|uniref:HNH endonuclease signature motif containing protein n=1 Tax=Enterobacter TaxID=547 RepID=UPI0006988DC4|nr:MULTISPECIES: HNH endonuclease signature motif containing protein [Enterobacter]PSF22547.1 HNH endonuclease [Escherichia coli]RYH37887.1 HNH endonuclease [Enterobacter cloacae]HAV1961769.1 HNH endonuclease [Enterobacter hormaechei subsp. xiangfangensis]HCT8382055.1 HNH endonuclease [Citrobacter freundii]ELC6410524.1 HNH endonuclease [Enterobacter hormaechei]
MATPILSDLIAVDPSSSTGLRWIVARGRQKAGSEAGCLFNSGTNQYYVVRINKVLYYAHRIVWELTNGKIAGDLTIDHIDGNGLNNAKENLRVASFALNLRNRRKSDSRESVSVGVSLNKRERDKGYKAHYRGLDGKKHFKFFGFSTHGEKRALELAIEWRKERMLELNEAGAGYTSRHLSGE